MCFLVCLQYSRETERKEEENMPEALHFARSGSGLRCLRLLAEGLDEAEEVHQMLCLPHRQRAPFCGHPWQRCNKILSAQMRAGGCGQGGDGAGAHRVCGGPAFGQGLLLRGGEARRCRGRRPSAGSPPSPFQTVPSPSSGETSPTPRHYTRRRGGRSRRPGSWSAPCHGRASPNPPRSDTGPG